MGKFLIRTWRILLDISGTYALIRQLVGSGAVTVIIGRFIWYWSTLPVGLRVLLVVVLFFLAWWLIALIVGLVNRSKWNGIMKRVKQNKNAMKILNTIEAMDTSLSERIPRQIELPISPKMKRKLTDEFLELFGIRIDRRIKEYKKYKAMYIVGKAVIVAYLRMSLHRRQVLADVSALLNTNGIGLSNSDYDSLNKKLDKLLKLSHPTVVRAVYAYLDHSNGLNNFVLFVQRDLDIEELKKYFPSWLWLKIRQLVYKRDQIMRVLYNQLALVVATKE